MRPAEGEAGSIGLRTGSAGSKQGNRSLRVFPFFSIQKPRTIYAGSLAGGKRDLGQGEKVPFWFGS